jgi:hypothetical protein
MSIVIVSIALAAWKLFGGNFDSFFTTVWGVFYAIVNAVSNVLVEAFTTVFGQIKK